MRFSPQSIDTVLFDMDGTLLDSREALLGAFHDATTEVLGSPFPITRGDADRIIQLSSKEVFGELARGDAAHSVKIEAAFHRSYRRRVGQLRLFAGVDRMLSVLRDDGLLLGIVTSKSRIRLDRDLEQNNIVHLFDVTVCGDEVAAAKPDPGPIRMAMEMLGTAPERVLFVGDGVNDIQAAHAAGTQAVAAGYGFHPDACRAAGSDHWVDAPQDLPALVRAIRGAPTAIG